MSLLSINVTSVGMSQQVLDSVLKLCLFRNSGAPCTISSTSPLLPRAIFFSIYSIIFKETADF